MDMKYLQRNRLSEDASMSSGQGTRIWLLGAKVGFSCPTLARNVLFDEETEALCSCGRRKNDVLLPRNGCTASGSMPGPDGGSVETSPCSHGFKSIVGVKEDITIGSTHCSSEISPRNCVESSVLEMVASAAGSLRGVVTGSRGLALVMDCCPSKTPAGLVLDWHWRKADCVEFLKVRGWHVSLCLTHCEHRGCFRSHCSFKI